MFVLFDTPILKGMQLKKIVMSKSNFNSQVPKKKKTLSRCGWI